MWRQKVIGMILLVLLFSVYEKASAQITAEKTKVIVARGSDIHLLLDKALSEFSELVNLIEKKDVVLKPDMSHNAAPEAGLTTNPMLIKYLVKRSYVEKAHAVFVFDHCVDEWSKCYKNSGIERVAKDESAKVFPGNSAYFYTERMVTGSSKFKKLKVHKAIHETGILVNIPVFKPDPKTTVSAGLKNLMGCVYDWDFYQENGLDQCLAEFLYFKKPELTIIDVSKMTVNPDDKKYPFILVISKNVVAADAVACRLSGVDPKSVKHLKIASGLGFGSLDANDIELKEIF